MKKMILSAMAVCAFAFTTNAQEITFGAKAGVNFANITGDIENNDMKIGFHVGGVAEIMLSDKFGVQPELLYSTQGSKSKYTILDTKVETTTKLDYLALPIMGKYKITEELSALAGPQISFLLKAEAEAEAGDESETTDFKDFTNGVDFGLNLGAEYKMESGLNFSARYNLGLTNISGGDYEGDDSIQNSVIQISVGYFFN